MSPKTFPAIARKATAIGCALAGSFLLLTACGPKATNPPASVGPESAPAAAAPSPAPPPAAAASTLPPSAVGSCSSPAIGFCTDYTGADHTAAVVKADCRIPGQVYSEFGCPVENRAGSCLSYPGKGIEILMRYSNTFPGGAAAAKAQCDEMLKGVWTAG